MDDVARLAAVARAALPRFGIPEASPVALLHHRENAVFRVDDDGSARPWALRVHRLGYRTGDEIRSELAWMDALRAAGLHTPAARPALDGDPLQRVAAPELREPRYVDVLSWIEGKPLDVAGAPDAYRLLGRTCAFLHAHARRWTPPSWFRRPTWEAERLLGPRAHWGDFADLAALAPDELALLQRAAALVLRRLHAFGQGPDRFGLTHGDLMPENILVQDGVPHVIDFDDCGYGWYLYDLATLLALKTADPDFERIRDGWVAGYRELAPLPDAHLVELETLVMARMLLGLGWMHTRRETPMAQAFTGAAIALSCAQAEAILRREEGRP